jgi:hypothetical protein
MEDVSQAEIENALRQMENHRRVMRESYYRHREARLEYRRQKYASERAVLGLAVGKRGRPRKYPADAEKEEVAVGGVE